MGMFMLLPILLLGGGLGGANELLDYAQTEAYWKAKAVAPSVDSLVAMIDAKPKVEDISALIKQLGHDDFDKREEATAAIARKGPGVIPQLKEATKSTDAEVADRATRLIAELTGGDTDPAIHKLMIIRTLGELKDKAALPALKPLTESKEPFVANYAKRAIATIEGKPFTFVGTSAETFEKDLWTLPKDVKLVSQLNMIGSGPLDWAKALEGAVLPGGAAGGPDKERMLGEMQKGVRTALNHVGNVRIDGVTLGVSGDPGPASGFVIVLVRGQYSREKAITALKKQGQAVSDTEGVPTFTAQNMNMILFSDELFAIVGGPPTGAVPIKETIAAIKAGKGTLAEDADMVALIKSADRKSGGWGVAQMTDTYRAGTTWMKPFDTVIANRITEKGKTTLKIVGAGKDAEAVAAAVAEMNKGLEETRTMFKQIPAGAGVPKPMIDFIDSLKIEAKDGKATLTGAIEGSFETMLGSMLVPMMMMGGPGGF